MSNPRNGDAPAESGAQERPASALTNNGDTAEAMRRKITELEAKLAASEAEKAELEAKNAELQERLAEPFLFQVVWSWPVTLKDELPDGVERTPTEVHNHFAEVRQKLRTAFGDVPRVHEVVTTDRKIDIPPSGAVSQIVGMEVEVDVPFDGRTGSMREVKEAGRMCEETRLPAILKDIPEAVRVNVGQLKLK